MVKESNQRCNQENLIEQLENGVRALHAPTNTLKAWMALWLPIRPRWKEKHRRERDTWLRSNEVV